MYITHTLPIQVSLWVTQFHSSSIVKVIPWFLQTGQLKCQDKCNPCYIIYQANTHTHTYLHKEMEREIERAKTKLVPQSFSFETPHMDCLHPIFVPHSQVSEMIPACKHWEDWSQKKKKKKNSLNHGVSSVTELSGADWLHTHSFFSVPTVRFNVRDHSWPWFHLARCQWHCVSAVWASLVGANYGRFDFLKKKIPLR